LGGIIKGNVILVEGAAGVGKTLLGLEFIYRGITEHDEPGIIVVFETSPRKLIRDATGFGWNLDELQQQNKLKIIFTSPKVLTADVHEISILGKRLAESRAIRCVPRLLELANEVRGDPFTRKVHCRLSPYWYLLVPLHERLLCNLAATLQTSRRHFQDIIHHAWIGCRLPAPMNIF
jgi:hypothetical protein